MTNQSYTDGYLKLWFHPDPRRCSKFLNLNAGWIAFCYHDIIFNYIQGTTKGSQLSFVPPLPDGKFFYCIPFPYTILYLDIITHYPYIEGYLYRIEKFFYWTPFLYPIVYHDIITIITSNILNGTSFCTLI